MSTSISLGREKWLLHTILTLCASCVPIKSEKGNISAKTGIYPWDGKKLDNSILFPMNNSLFHRNHNGCAVWREDLVEAGHCMLRMTLDTLDEQSPLTRDDCILAFTADTRIENRDKLITDLEAYLT